MGPRRQAVAHSVRRCLCGFALLMAACTASASEYHGRVRYEGLPVPGATVTVTEGAKKFSTVTDGQGVYEFPDLGDGTWKIQIAMSGFSTLENSVTVTPTVVQGEWDLQLLSTKALLAEAKPAPSEAVLLQRQPVEQKPEKKKETESQNAPEPPAPEPDEASQKSSNGLLINGSESNASTSPFTLSPAFGNRHPGIKSLYTGSFGAIADSSVFDARPYSLTGLEVPKDNYSRVTFVVTLGGPIRIPHLLYYGPNFFLAYQWTRDSDATTASGLVPDTAERSGDLSGVTSPLGQPLTIYNPATGMPFVGPIPVSPQAQALLNLYPLPNLAGNSQYNYETGLLSSTHVDALQSRLDKAIGHRDEFYGGFGFQNIRADSVNLFHFSDTTDTLGLDGHVNWQHRLRSETFVVTGYHLTRLRTQVRPQFANSKNISGNAGITGNDQDPTNWGPPSLEFSSGIASLNDALSEFNRNRTDNGSLKVTTTYWNHTITLGGDFRRQEFNELSQQNPRGVFTFTGAATSQTGSTSTTSGSDLADFLLGVPDTSALAYGNADKYFRQSVYDVYATDDWRVQPELTISAGVRWEYGAPPTELFGRLVNLDIASGFSAVAPVLGSSPKGSLTGTSYPTSLVRPDKNGFEPRIGISWRPLPASTLVVRAGYGIYDDTSIYLTSTQMMSQQSPLSNSVSVANSGDCPLTLANGFRDCAGTTADTFAVDPNLHVGYAQVWQVSAQRDLPAALVMTTTYMGVKGTHGMQEFLPNTYAPGHTSPCPQCPVGFVYRTSGGNSTRESGSVQLRRRLRSGFAASLLYTYSKSVDDDAQVGAQGHAQATSETSQDESASSTGTGPTIAQNWLDLRAEQGPSTFDQRQVLSAEIQYTSGMGIGGRTLLSGWRGRLLKDWTALSRISASSGLPETPIYLEAVPGTGVTGTIRPDLTGAPVYQTSNGYFLNAAAYSAPTAGQWGSAGRDSIRGPNQFTLDGSLSRTFRLRDPFNLDIRLDATNLLNHGVFSAWNTTVNSTTFGLPAGANSMRSIQLTGRLRF
ncbi:MAG: TonB-dependent receptor [Acidobacteriaceae bacterium]